MLNFKHGTMAEDFLRDVIRDSERFGRFQMSDKTSDPEITYMCFSMWMKATELGITGMLNLNIQHFAHDYVTSLDPHDDDLDYWGIDPNNVSECFPYYNRGAA